MMNAWFALCALLIAGIAGLNLVRVCQRVPPPPRRSSAVVPEVVSRQEARFAGVREALRRHGARGTVGYIVDAPPTDGEARHKALEDYFLTQFALAPWVLDANCSGCDWIVLNARSQPVPAEFEMVQDFGDVRLLRKAAR